MRGGNSSQARRALPRLPVPRGPPTSAGPSALRPTEPLGTQQTSRGKTLRLRHDHVANTTSGTDRNRASLPRASSPAEDRLTALHSRSQPQRTYGFFQTRPHGHPPAAVPRPPASHPVNSGPRPCLISDGFPLSGLQYRTLTSGLNTMPGTPARLRLAPERQRSAPSAINRKTENPTAGGATSDHHGGASASHHGERGVVRWCVRLVLTGCRMRVCGR